MASLAVGTASIVFSWNPFLAAGAMAVAAYIDQKYVYPELIGKQKVPGRPRSLVGLPQSTNTPGTPRVWAIGRCVRIPCHIMLQSEKTRETTTGGSKGGVAQQIKRVFADVGLHVNDRSTMRLSQLIANGQLIWWTDKNLLKITTSEMTSSVVETVIASNTVLVGGANTTTRIYTTTVWPDNLYTLNYHWIKITSGPLSGQLRSIVGQLYGYLQLDEPLTGVPAGGVTFDIVRKQLKLTMNTTYEADFSERLEIDDVVRLEGFSSTPNNVHYGPAPFNNTSWWIVAATKKHDATPSSVTLEAAIGQDMANIVSVTAGTQFSPAQIVREDTDWVDTLTGGGWDGFFRNSDLETTAFGRTYRKRWERVIGTRSKQNVLAWNLMSAGWASGSPIPQLTLRPDGAGPFEMSADNYGVGLEYLPYTYYAGFQSRTTHRRYILRPTPANSFVPGMFQSNPANNFHDGNDSQLEDDIVARNHAAGQIPAFRGMSYVMLDQWDLSTYFGNQVPPIIEAIIQPDFLMTVPTAINTICQRAQLQDLIVDTSQVTQEAFEGFWTQGELPTVTLLQPVLLAYSIAAQERNDTLSFFSAGNADVVAVENGPAFSDLGVTSGADTPTAGDKIKITQRDTQDLPTSIGVSHQDPDQQYGIGYQHFKQRQPTRLLSQNEQNVNLENLVLPRKKARNLATTLMRRAWVNATGLEFQLPVAYLEALENDLVTLTDDEGNDYVARIVRREIGNNFVVNVSAVIEDTELLVRGSPVQPVDDIIIATPSASTPVARVLDIPPLIDGDATVPGYYVGACSTTAWNGAIVYESRDGGTNWTQVATLNMQCGMGVLNTDLAAGPAGDGVGVVTYDTVNTFTAEIYQDNVLPLTSVSTTQVEEGWNWMLVQDGSNWEILGARDVTDNGDGTYTFGYLLRGLRGTYDSAATTKAVGSSVTFLHLARQLGALQFVATNLSAGSLPASVQIKVVGVGQQLVDVTAQSISLECWNARPMPGRMFTTETDVVTFQRTFVFENWTRLQGIIGSGGPYNLDESFEGYRVDIYNPAGTTLLRSKTITSAGSGSNRIRGDRSVPYTPAEQTADGYTPGLATTFKVKRYQLGDFGNGRSWLETV